MKTLMLLRHAKSGWDDLNLRDFDRRLNPKGERAAAAMGRHLRDLGIGWDVAVASPAARVRETVAQLAAGYGRAIEPAWDRRLYLAAAPVLLEIAQALSERAPRALIVGHNPGLEDLVLLLTPDRSGDRLRDDVELKFPTASLAVLELTAERWADVAPDSATLARFVRPRDLDPALGPEVA